MQTVNARQNPLYYKLIREFGRQTGVPVLLNTSFNENEPVVCRPEEALDCFLRTKMDLLVMGAIHRSPELTKISYRRPASSDSTSATRGRAGFSLTRGEGSTCMKRVLVTGAGGFIGHHLVSYLKKKSYWVRGADLKYPEYEPSAADEFALLDLRRWEDCLKATDGIDEVYALAADMGGMGYISAHHAEILRNNSLINIHTLDAARENGAKRYLYTSSACVYPEYRQTDANVTPLKEEDAYPAQPQDAYGWEKLVTERLCTHYREDYGTGDAHRALPQHLRPAGHLGWRPREGAGSVVPQGVAGEA